MWLCITLEKEGITNEETKLASITQINYPNIIDKLTDPVWRPRLEKICSAFKNSHADSVDVWLGVPEGMFTLPVELDYMPIPLNVACDWLECTS